MPEEQQRERSPLYLARPPKPVSQMTDAELTAWADEIIRAFAEAEGLELD